MSSASAEEFKPRTVETEPVGMDRWDIISSLHLNGKFFIQFYLAEELTFEVPKFHDDSWTLITCEMIQYIALALPRGHAKTTLAKLCCVWYLLFTPTRFIVYLSNTNPAAAEACKDIIAYLLSDNHRQVFGETEFKVFQDAKGFYKFWLNVPDGKGGFYRKFCILKALGAEQQVRGLNIDNERPQLAVVDDLEDNDNTATEFLQKKLKKWFYGTFFKAMSKKRHKIIYLGNMLSNSSLLYHICEKSPMWYSMRYGALLSTGLPLWPEMWSVESLQKDYMEYQTLGLTSLWFAEMMNMPMAEDRALISPDEIIYAPRVLEGQQTNAFITVDPAFSTKTWGNETAIAVHAWKSERWQVVETIHGKFGAEELFMLLMDLCNRWNTRAVGIEGGSYELGLRQIFTILMKAYNQSFAVLTIPHGNRSKTERLAGWAGALKKKIWCLTEGDVVITEQLLNYDPSKSNNIDDIIDACSMGIMMVELYMSDIMTAFEVQPERYRLAHVVNN